MDLDKILDVATSGDEETIYAVYNWTGPSIYKPGTIAKITYHYEGVYNKNTMMMKKAIHKQISDKPLNY